MKKYHQLLLLVVSVISLSLFLIYRHQYNRLHYVLEVFNFFGTPCNFTELQQSNSILRQHDWGPHPVWQETEVGYIYSAFLTGSVEVKVIAVKSEEKNVPRSCYLWYEEKKKPILGKLKVSKLAYDDKNSLTSYFYMCSLSNIENVPYAVSFASKIKGESESLKILLANMLNHKVFVNTTICVMPLGYTKKKLIEFISFHRLIGIDSFIFYNKDIPYRLSKLLSNLSNRLSLQLSFLPWNFPKNSESLIRSIVENDCLLRTVGQTQYVITLDLNEYIVPRTAINFEAVVNNVSPDAQVIRFPIQLFCISNLSMTKPTALQNFKAIDDFSYNIVRHLHKNIYSSNNSTAINNNYKSNTSIHKYVRCNSEPTKTIIDKNILNFSTDFTRTMLVQLLIHNQI